jgi:hypothetical protein
MTVEDFLNHPSTVSRVLSSLGNKVKLPNEGFVAGGSVANMLLSLYHLGTDNRFEVNDVDIFTVKQMDESESVYDFNGEGENGLFTNPLNLSLGVHNDDYGHVYVERDGTFYKVLKAERDGLINSIECIVGRGEQDETIRYTPPAPEEHPNMIMMPVTQTLPTLESYWVKNADNDIILRGFDINCCQAGIDLSNGILHYTNSFVEFMKSKQLLVDIPYTPLHTTIRLIKKFITYGGFCYCNLEEEFRYLHQASTLSINECGRIIGKETYEKYKKYERVSFHYIVKDEIKTQNVDLTKYFKLRRPHGNEIPNSYRKEHFTQHEFTSHYYGQETPLDDSKITNEAQDLWFWESTGVFENIDQKFRHVYELKRIWELLYRNRKKSHQKKIDMILNFGSKRNQFSTNTALQAFEVFDEYQGRSYPAKCLLVNDDYYKCDFTQKHLEEIERFFSEHRRLCGLFSRLNLQEQYQKMSMLKALSNKEGEWVIGVLENVSLESQMINIEITKEWVQGLIEKEKERMGKPLCEAYDLSEFKYKDCVKELTSPLDLKVEGSVMGHCVGGYSYSIEKGLSRIFHIEVDGIGSTLEIGINKNPSLEYSVKEGSDERFFSVKQHYGRYPEKGNLRPTNKNRGVAFKLCYFLAKNHLSDEELKNSLKMEPMKTYDPNTFLVKDTSRKTNKWRKWLGDGHATVRRKNLYEKTNEWHGQIDFFNERVVQPNGDLPF